MAKKKNVVVEPVTLTTNEIAEKLDVHPMTVKKIGKRLGLTPTRGKARSGKGQSFYWTTDDFKAIEAAKR